MKITITGVQAAQLNLRANSEFIRAAFYTGHSINYVLEHAFADVYSAERAAVIKLAYELGMCDADTVEIMP